MNPLTDYQNASSPVRYLFQEGLGRDQKMISVRVVENQERFGQDNQLIHMQKDPLVEFFVLSKPLLGIHSFDPLSERFVSRYFLSTLKSLVKRDVGLVLKHGTPDIRVTADILKGVARWAHAEHWAHEYRLNNPPGSDVRPETPRPQPSVLNRKWVPTDSMLPD